MANHRDDDSPESGPLSQEALRAVPVFPLPNVVMFPHALLPLHIFEQRYRKMARDLLAGNRLLVVAQLSPEEAEEPVPRLRGMAGLGEVIMAHELPDGRFNLVLRGRERVRIEREIPSDEPYRLISAKRLPDIISASESEIVEADQALRALVTRLADAIPDGGELLRQVIMAQESPAALADVLAAALVTDPAVRQALLETRDLLKRLERVSAEVVAMTSRLGNNAGVN